MQCGVDDGVAERRLEPGGLLHEHVPLDAAEPARVGEVALFVDADPDQVDAAMEVGANAVELHTGDFANARTPQAAEHQAGLLARAAARAHGLGLAVHAGHGLDYRNYATFQRLVPHVHEVSIGFAVVARAVLVGLEQAVREMRLVVKGY